MREPSPPNRRRSRLKPSYTTKVHLKRTLRATDWLFLVALTVLIFSVVLAIIYFG